MKPIPSNLIMIRNKTGVDNMPILKVVRWIGPNDLAEYQECDFDEKHLDALMRELVHNKYVICGDTHQSEEHTCIPLFEDGYLLLSMRRWAEVMSNAYFHINFREYLKEPWFYMKSTCAIKEHLPNRG